MRLPSRFLPASLGGPLARLLRQAGLRASRPSADAASGTAVRAPAGPPAARPAGSAADPRQRPLAWLAAAALLLALAQQQLLLRRPPRLERISAARLSSGPGALDLRFTRPMQAGSLARRSRLQPPLPHEWLGGGSTYRLLLRPGSTLQQPLTLALAGVDPRGMALPAQPWRWDPRPRLLAIVQSRQGEQVQLQEHDGQWIALTPHWRRIEMLQALGDGSGLVLAAVDSRDRLQTWRLNLRQRNLAPLAQGLAPPQLSSPRLWQAGPLQYAMASSNRQGELLLQSAAVDSASSEVLFWDGAGHRRRLPIEASGPIQLVPQGGAMVIPHPDGLMLQRLSEPLPRPQVLPGQRDLSSFCPSGGAALLVQHRPDYSRALELLQPGQAPRPLWQGRQGILASACDGAGERVWLLLVEAVGRPRLTLLALDRQGRLLRRRELAGWELEPGSGLQLDRSRNQLLLVLRPLSPADPQRRTRQLALPALVDASSLELKLLAKPVRQVQWLPPG